MYNSSTVLSRSCLSFDLILSDSFSAETGGWRGLRVTDGRVYQVDSNWGNATYIAVYPKDNKRKGDSEIEDPISKTKRLDSKSRCSGLRTLGLATSALWRNLLLLNAAI